MKKSTWVFIFQKYGKIRVLLEKFIKHKHLISEECVCNRNWPEIGYRLLYEYWIQSKSKVDQKHLRDNSNQAEGKAEQKTSLACKDISNNEYWRRKKES